MTNTVGFITTVTGLKVKFTNTSSSLLEGQSFKWDFGDGNASTEKDPVHQYGEAGSFFVILHRIDSNGSTESIQQEIRVTDKVKTQLSGSIYDLIDQYIPKSIFGDISYATKRLYIEKWQLYIQPLVNHLIPEEEYKNEFYYEALENQLIMELAAYDFLTWSLAKSIEASSVSIINSTTGGAEDSESSEGRVKKISTGPTEVEYFEGVDSDSSVIKALQSSGVIDILKQSLCGLSDRLDIYLPMCRARSLTQVPKVVNRRSPGLLGGPDPSYPVKK